MLLSFSVSGTALQFHQILAADLSLSKNRAAGLGRLRLNISQYSFYGIDDILRVTKPVIPKHWL